MDDDDLGHDSLLAPIRTTIDLHKSGPGPRASVFTQLRDMELSRLDVFKIGSAIGFGIALVIVSSYYVFSPPIMQFAVYEVSAPIFYANILLFYPVLCWAIVLFIFERHEVQYASVLDLRPHLITSVQVLKNALTLFDMWLASYLCFSIAAKFTVTVHVFSLASFSVPSTLFTLANFLTLGIFVWPLRGFHRSSRKVLMGDLISILRAPFLRTTFRQSLMADVTTSLVIPLRLFLEGACLVVTGGLFRFELSHTPSMCLLAAPVAGDVISVTPYLWRLTQCVERWIHTRENQHVFNAAKYATCVTAVLFSALCSVLASLGFTVGPAPHTLKIILVMVSTCYCYLWDVFVDWALLCRGSGPIPSFRPGLYPHRWAYRIAPITNFIMRFAWALTLPSRPLFPYPLTLQLILGAVEVTRRFIWVVLRVENEVVQRAADVQPHRMSGDRPDEA